MNRNSWIGLTAVLAIAAIGLGIWGSSQKSDKDDAQDEVAQLKGELGQSESSDAAQTKFGATEVVRYGAARRRLISSDKQKADFKNEVTQKANTLATAQQNLANATSEEDKQAAQIKAEAAERDTAVACAQGMVDIVGKFLQDEGTAPGPAAESAMDQMEDLQPSCEKVLKG